jgi:hypothetical protein
MAEHQGNELAPAGHALGVLLAFVPGHGGIETSSGEES